MPATRPHQPSRPCCRQRDTRHWVKSTPENYRARKELINCPGLLCQGVVSLTGSATGYSTMPVLGLRSVALPAPAMAARQGFRCGWPVSTRPARSARAASSSRYDTPRHCCTSMTPHACRVRCGSLCLSPDVPQQADMVYAITVCPRLCPCVFCPNG